MELRDYQQQAVNTIVRDAQVPGNSVVVLPCGSGKSLVIAKAVERLANTSLILCPNREILSQNHKKLSQYVPENSIGVYSASFDRKDIRKYTLATIQSIYKRPELFEHIPLVFVDECNLVSVKAASSMYTDFFKKVGNPKVFGLTATPYRLETGYEMIPNGLGQYDMVASTMLKIITRMRHKNAKEIFWKRIIYNLNHKELVDAGFLTEITYIENPIVEYKEIPVNKSRSDYDLEAYDEMIVGHEAVAVEVIRQAEQKHHSVLVFCVSVEQAERLTEVIEGAEVVTGGTSKKERERIIAEFKDGKIKTVLNVGVLTTGFDHPQLDAVVLLRPTRSPLLYNQMVGRLTRIAEGKKDAVLYDLSDTVKMMGRVETFELFRNDRGMTDLRTEKSGGWHNRVLFRFKK